MSETPFLLIVAVFAIMRGPLFAFSLPSVCCKDYSSLGTNTHSESGISKIAFIPYCITRPRKTMAFIFASVFVFHHKQQTTSLKFTTQRGEI